MADSEDQLDGSAGAIPPATPKKPTPKKAPAKKAAPRKAAAKTTKGTTAKKSPAAKAAAKKIPAEAGARRRPPGADRRPSCGLGFGRRSRLDWWSGAR